MKVVLFCGGLGLRIREHANDIPKPMVKIGYKPILWHLMKYYAFYGHKDFILCLGYKADVIKNYFVNYDEFLSNDFILTQGCNRVELLSTDLQDWRITFVDTGLHSNIGQRLKAIEPYLRDDEVFMANYSDGLTDLPLESHIEHFSHHNKVASFICVRPSQSFHVVSMNKHNIVNKINHVKDNGLLMNGGYFIFKKEIFQHIKEGEDLVEEPFQRLIRKKELIAYHYDGFWACMDTFKEKSDLERIYAQGTAPWELWRSKHV